MRRLVALLLLQAACTEPSVEYPGPPALAIGVGHDELVPIEDGDAIPIARGPQGGTILWGAASARYLDPRELELVFSVIPPEGAASLRRVIVDLDDDDGGVTLGHQVFLPDADRFAGLPCLWRVEAIDREGRTAIDEKTVIPTALP